MACGHELVVLLHIHLLAFRFGEHFLKIIRKVRHRNDRIFSEQFQFVDIQLFPCEFSGYDVKILPVGIQGFLHILLDL